MNDLGLCCCVHCMGLSLLGVRVRVDFLAADGQCRVSLELGGNMEKCFLSVEMSGEQVSHGTCCGRSPLRRLYFPFHLLQLTRQHPLLTSAWLLA